MNDAGSYCERKRMEAQRLEKELAPLQTLLEELQAKRRTAGNREHVPAYEEALYQRVRLLQRRLQAAQDVGD